MSARRRNGKSTEGNEPAEANESIEANKSAEANESTETKEGWETLEEEVERLAPNPELDEALRAATEAIESRETTSAESPASGGKGAGGPQDELSVARDQLLRLQADFENFRRRAAQERQHAQQYGHQNLVKDLLPTVDNLERALEHAKKGGESGGLDGLLQGVELVLRDCMGVLERYGLEEVPAQGETFDPNIHEAMTQVPGGDAPPNSVIEVFEKGYRLRDRMLRPAKVVVAAPDGTPAAAAATEPEETEE